jgi:hypothetical protein
MEKEENRRIKIIAPVGELPSPDKELRRRVNEALSKGASLSKIFRIIDEREKESLIEFSKMEKTKKSGIIDVTTAVNLEVLRIS